jgi:hypothetical protein
LNLAKILSGSYKKLEEIEAESLNVQKEPVEHCIPGCKK